MALPLFMASPWSEPAPQSDGGQDISNDGPRGDLLGEQSDVRDVDVEIEEPPPVDGALVDPEVEAPVAVVAPQVVAAHPRRGVGGPLSYCPRRPRSQFLASGRPATKLKSWRRSKSYGIHCDPCSRSERDSVYEIHPNTPDLDCRRSMNSTP